LTKAARKLKELAERRRREEVRSQKTEVRINEEVGGSEYACSEYADHAFLIYSGS
jgi:hypothetical protein